MTTVDGVRDKALQDYRNKLLEHKEVESRLKAGKFSIFLGYAKFCIVTATLLVSSIGFT
jgi:hypothetical protein